jgi:type II restriction enzyme
MILTAANIVKALGELPRDIFYEYFNDKTNSKLKITSAKYPEGPVKFERITYKNGKRSRSQNSFSRNMIRRYASAFIPEIPINIDRVLSASYNSRSALESLLAHTPEFYFCHPGRIEISHSTTEIKSGHKHLVWLPDNPHPALQLETWDTDLIISELGSSDAYFRKAEYDATQATSTLSGEQLRMHAQMQVALVDIGNSLKFKSYVAKNDQSIKVGNEILVKRTGVIPNLHREKLFQGFPEAANAAELIDCIWLKNGTKIPAIIEVEYTTGVKSGLTRMLNYKNLHLDLASTRYVIAAPDEQREKVLKDIHTEQFKPLKAKFLPFSGIHELYALHQSKRLDKIDSNCSASVFDMFLES